MMIQKQDFEKPLKSLYGIKAALIEKDSIYLYKAYNHIEDLWWRNLKKMKEVKYVLVGEAPLYGNNQKYIYNPESAGTSFLSKRAVQKFSSKAGYSISIKNKEEMLECMRSIGLIVVDLFPYAFNEETSIQYAGISDTNRKMLASASSEWNLKPKLSEIRNKTSNPIIFGVRYKRLFSFASEVLGEALSGVYDFKVNKAFKVRNVNGNEKAVANAPLDIDSISSIIS